MSSFKPHQTFRGFHATLRGARGEVGPRNPDARGQGCGDAGAAAPGPSGMEHMKRLG